MEQFVCLIGKNDLFVARFVACGTFGFCEEVSFAPTMCPKLEWSTRVGCCLKDPVTFWRDSF